LNLLVAGWACGGVGNEAGDGRAGGSVFDGERLLHRCEDAIAGFGPSICTPHSAPLALGVGETEADGTGLGGSFDFLQHAALGGHDMGGERRARADEVGVKVHCASVADGERNAGLSTEDKWDRNKTEQKRGKQSDCAAGPSPGIIVGLRATRKLTRRVNLTGNALLVKVKLFG